MKPRFVRPELLLHPNLVKPLHGVSPRLLKGRKWWDEVRQGAYAENNYCCWACGTWKHKAHYRQWLEAHERYNINYVNGIVTLEEVVALCKACHSFIHSGRMWALFMKGEVSMIFLEDVLGRGIRILRAAGLSAYAFFGTADIALILRINGDDLLAASRRRTRKTAEWDKWRLVLDGEEHYSPYADEDAWRAHYDK